MAVEQGAMLEEKTRKTLIWRTVQVKGETVITTLRENDEEVDLVVVLTVGRKVPKEKIPPKRKGVKEREEVEECEVSGGEVDAAS